MNTEKMLPDQKSESKISKLNRTIFARVQERMTDPTEPIIQRATCVWSTRHPPMITKDSIAIFPNYGYMSFSAPVGHRRLYASLSVHSGEVRIGIVLPPGFATTANDRIVNGEVSDKVTRIVDFGETGVLYDWFLTEGACSLQTMITAMSHAETAEAVADYIAHKTHNIYFAVLGALAARCGLTYTADGAFEQEDMDKWFVTVEGPEQPQMVQDKMAHRFGTIACVEEEGGAWCYLVAAPKETKGIETEITAMLGAGYQVKAYGRAPGDHDGGEDSGRNAVA
ncbi:MAG: hypothetical protein ACYDHY_18220 [Acidiferrobacterales bacterium]